MLQNVLWFGTPIGREEERTPCKECNLKEVLERRKIMEFDAQRERERERERERNTRFLLGR
jgi:hypothetical protein